MSGNMSEKVDKICTTYFLFDLETIGISVNKDDIVEISALKVKDGFR